MFELNKNFNLLEEDLAVSGLEMSVFGIISGVASIAGGIFGATQASSSNRAAAKAQKKQEEAAEEAADAANKYNKQAFEVEKQNYYNARNYQRETDIQAWRYNQSIQDYEYRAVVNRYAKSVENTQDQLVFNSMAAVDAYAAEQASLNEMVSEDAFSRQGMLVDRLQQEGTAALGQAGNSRNKAIQSRLAAAGRDSSIMDASLASSVEQSKRNLNQIAMQRYGADLAAKAQMMIRPEAVPDIPVPTQAPERIFIEPMEVTPTYIPPAVQQSTVAPIVSGISSGASAFAKVPWDKIFGQ
jgi:hypothetical protein